MFGNLATGHFSGKNFSRCTPSGPTGTNDTCLKSVWPPGAESIAGQTQWQTEFEYYIYIDNVNIYEGSARGDWV